MVANGKRVIDVDPDSDVDLSHMADGIALLTVARDLKRHFIAPIWRSK